MANDGGLQVELIIFYGLAFTAITSALLVIMQRRALYSALALIVTFGSMAGLFFQLGAQFIAAIQVIIYAGAIMVLFVFVIMLIDPEAERFSADRLKRLTILAVPLVGFLAFILYIAYPAASVARTELGVPPGGEIEFVARTLFVDYLLPFEATSILILVAVIGAVVLTKRRD